MEKKREANVLDSMEYLGAWQGAPPTLRGKLGRESFIGWNIPSTNVQQGVSLTDVSWGGGGTTWEGRYT